MFQGVDECVYVCVRGRMSVCKRRLQGIEVRVCVVYVSEGVKSVYI